MSNCQKFCQNKGQPKTFINSPLKEFVDDPLLYMYMARTKHEINVANTCFKAMNGWTNDNWSTYITSITITGAMIGALFSGSFTKYGKKRMIQVLNVILLCSVGICMIN